MSAKTAKKHSKRDSSIHPRLMQDQFESFQQDVSGKLVEALRKAIVPAAIDALARSREEYKRIALLEADLNVHALHDDIQVKADRIKALEQDRDAWQAAFQAKLAETEPSFVWREVPVRRSIGDRLMEPKALLIARERWFELEHGLYRAQCAIAQTLHRASWGATWWIAKEDGGRLRLMEGSVNDVGVLDEAAQVHRTKLIVEGVLLRALKSET